VYGQYTGKPRTIGHHIVYGRGHIMDSVQPYSGGMADQGNSGVKLFHWTEKVAWSYIMISCTAILSDKVLVADPLLFVLHNALRPLKLE
jgi:hypothetical protein